MKSLKPSAKENKRYLLIKGKNLGANVEKALFDFLGVLGVSKLGMKWIKKDVSSGILAVNREGVDSVRASLCVWPEKISVEKVSGTLRGLGR